MLAQEEYIKEEQRSLKRELLRAQEEVKRIQSVPLVIGQFLEMVDGSSGIVGSTTGSNYYVRILSTLNRCAHTHACMPEVRAGNAYPCCLSPEVRASCLWHAPPCQPGILFMMPFLAPLLL